MRTVHVGFGVENLERSLDFHGILGYEVVGTVSETGIGSLTMLNNVRGVMSGRASADQRSPLPRPSAHRRRLSRRTPKIGT